MAGEGPLERLKNGTAPRDLRIAIAEGLFPLDGNDLVTAMSILATDPDDQVRRALEANIPTLPRMFLLDTVRSPNTTAELLDLVARVFREDDEILTRVILNKNTTNETLIFVASNAPAPTLALLSDNRQRIIACPEILDALLDNEQLPRVNRYSLLEFQETWREVLDENRGKVQGVPRREAEPEVETAESAPPDGAPEGLDEASAAIEEAAETAPPEGEGEKEEPLAVEDSEPVDESLEWMEEEAPEMRGEEEAFEDVEASDEPMDGWSMKEILDGVKPEIEDDEDYGFDEDEFAFIDEDDLAETGGTEGGEFDDWEDVDIDEEFDAAPEEDELDEEFAEEEKAQDTRMRLMKLGAAEKMVLAKMGTKQERAILVRDPNKKVAVAVINSPKLSEFEVKMYAGNRSVCEDVLREIYMHREWGKSPVIRKELILNPKTPLSISLKLLPYLSDMDLKEVAKSKEVPYGLSANAKRLYDIREMRRQRRTRK